MAVPGSVRAPLPAANAQAGIACLVPLAFCAGILLVAAIPSARAQVITLDSQGRPVHGTAGTVDRRFAQVQPTHVELSKRPLDPRTRADLLRSLLAEQGFAMRPLPRGHKGLTLVANGKLEPAGEAYLDMVTAQGITAKPGDRVVITDLKFDGDKLILMLNGGPDAKHRFLRHIQLGTGEVMNPVVQDSGDAATGARLTLAFKGHIPELTGAQVKALLTPLISFDVKTPIQAFTDTLPPALKNAILEHHVWVGMSTDMVMFALGQPQKKIRDMDGQMPFEEWIYGTPPEPVQFVRINGNRVIRVEIAKVGEPPEIFTRDVVTGMMQTDGLPVIQDSHTRVLAEGDAPRDPNTQTPAPPPTLRNAGEKLPQDSDKQSMGTMRPVQFPQPKPDDYPDATNLPRKAAPPDNTQAQNSTSGNNASGNNASGNGTSSAQPGTAKQPAPAKANDTAQQAKETPPKDKPQPAPEQMPGSTQPE